MNPPGGLFRFKWGVGRIVMDSEVMPEIIPIWISGMLCLFTAIPVTGQS
jgi:monolysocardiolipin acyltransferase